MDTGAVGVLDLEIFLIIFFGDKYGDKCDKGQKENILQKELSFQMKLF